MSKLHYTAPSDEIFAELKEKARKIWYEIFEDQSYEKKMLKFKPHKDYLKEKLDFLNSLKNIKDNFMVIFNMFHPSYRNLLIMKVSKKCMQEILNRS